MALKYAKNALAAGALPGPCWGAHDAPPAPQTLSRLGRGTPTPPQIPPFRRLWRQRRLDPRACCARFSTRAVPFFFKRSGAHIYYINHFLVSIILRFDTCIQHGCVLHDNDNTSDNDPTGILLRVAISIKD